MLYGILAALGFGLADFLTAIATRRVGTVFVLVVSQVVGMALILAYLAASGTPLGGVPASAWTLMILGGVAAGAGYFALYRGLELGPIALVSPIVAADSAFGVILFVVFLHETLSRGAVAAVAVTITGVILASTDLQGLARLEARPPVRRGIAAALVSLVFFTIGLFAAGYYTKPYGWFIPLFASRLGTGAVLAAFLGATRARDLRGHGTLRDAGLAATIGVADLLGFATFTRGTQVTLASIVTAASATFPLIPVAGGLILFGERPAVTQAAGVAMVIGGLVLLGLAR